MAELWVKLFQLGANRDLKSSKGADRGKTALDQVSPYRHLTKEMWQVLGEAPAALKRVGFTAK